MKKYLLTIVALLPIAAMAQDETEPLETVCQKKAFELFSQVAADASDNICFSPLSVQMAMAMVQNGAAGNTLSQMQYAFGTTGYSNDELNVFNKNVDEILTNRPAFNYDPTSRESEEQQRKRYDAAYPICELANGVWTRAGTIWHEQFLQTMQDFYNAGFGSVDFTTQEGVNEINGWVNDKTHGTIPKVLDEPLSPDLAMLFANTLYFKGSWKKPFDPNQTDLGTFHNPNGIDVQTYMMHVQDYFLTRKTEQFLTLRMPYGMGDFSMTIFLPIESASLPELTCDDWKQAFDSKEEPCFIDVQMPSFDIDDKYDLKNVLQRMGMVDAFKRDLADFNNMSEDLLWIDKVFQCSKIEVNETGTVATAATVVQTYDNGMPPTGEFIVNRPFYYTIENRNTGSVLFVGRVTQLKGMSMPQDGILLSCPDENHPHAIDLGLPSGTKWACCNVGATSPEGYGGYYSWGETEEKDFYGDNYLYLYQDSNGDWHYQDIGNDIAGTQYDVAQVKWGEEWQMPSQTQQEELMYCCISTWTSINGICGYVFVSKKNGSNIFLPASGLRLEGKLPTVGYYAGYWSSTLYPWFPNQAYLIGFNDRDGVKQYRDGFITGRSVRPVCMGTSTVMSQFSPIIANNSIYNIYGIKVADNATNMNTLPPGIYIVNGKKQMVK